MERIAGVTMPRLLAAAAVALIVAGCSGSSASPAPSAAASAAAPPASVAPGQSTAPSAPAESAAPSTAVAASQAPVGGCADMAAMGDAMKNADHYTATAKIEAAIPGTSVGEAGFSLEMTMQFQKPDKMHLSTGGLFETISIGGDTWISMFGSGQWVKSDPTDTSGSSDLFGEAFASPGMEQLSEIPADVVLPGDSSCVIGYKVKLPSMGSDSDLGANPLGQLGDAAAIVVRVDTATGLPQSMAFVLDPTKLTDGAPTSMVFTFDYATPVDIQPPDPSTVVEGTGLENLLPSGMTLPSFEIPSIAP
jgi:hypothetical protein